MRLLTTQEIHYLQYEDGFYDPHNLTGGDSKLERFIRSVASFDNSYLWSNKKGIFLYPRERNADAVARELVKYARNLPAAKAGREPAKRN